jgi:putative photosynthetic complex assembly protein 2
MAYALPALFAVFLWWFATGAIFYLDGLPVRTFKWSMLGATALTALAFLGLWRSAGEATVLNAYCAFASALVIWGWMEISLYMGYVTGPRKHRCAHGCSGAKHFGHAIAVNLWHEIAIVLGAAAVFALSWGQPNDIGLWTYLLLWLMHMSARLNVFLGVRNVSEEFVPPHMEVLKSFLTKKPMNPLFPVSVTVSTVIAALLVAATVDAATPFAIAKFSLLSAIMLLAVVEHWFLMLPLPSAALWKWSLSSRPTAAPVDLPSAEIVAFTPKDLRKAG